MEDFFIKEDNFKVWLPDVVFYENLEKSEDNDAHNSRRIAGIMSTDRRDRQGEIIKADGLDFNDFLHNGHFNDNHSQETSAIVGYPEKVQYHKSLAKFGLEKASGWTCEGYILKGTKRADGLWELAKALCDVPDKKLGFSIEGKVLRREDKTIHKARIRNVAITNCPVNTDCTWDTISKSFHDSDVAVKAMMAGFGTSPATQSGGGALRVESVESDAKDVTSFNKKKKKAEEALKRALNYDDLLKAMEFVLEKRPDFTEEAAATFINFLFKKGGRL